MAVALVFDIYGTLIDTAGVNRQIKEFVGEESTAFARLWRQKQLEYSFRRGLMQNYVVFSECTRQALDFTCSSLQINLQEEQKESLLSAYRSLPVFEDVTEGLYRAKEHGFRIFAFSNGSRKAVGELLNHNEIEHFFEGIVSASDIKSFKPNPAVYAHCMRQIGSYGGDIWMISSNSFDVLGAKSAGMRAAWIQRSPDKILDPWELQPDLKTEGLAELPEQINKSF